jgi:hypothetical protein
MSKDLCCRKHSICILKNADFESVENIANSSPKKSYRPKTFAQCQKLKTPFFSHHFSMIHFSHDLFATCSTDSKLASNSTFFYTYIEFFYLINFFRSLKGKPARNGSKHQTNIFLTIKVCNLQQGRRTKSLKSLYLYLSVQ